VICIGKRYPSPTLYISYTFLACAVCGKDRRRMDLQHSSYAQDWILQPTPLPPWPDSPTNGLLQRILQLGRSMSTTCISPLLLCQERFRSIAIAPIDWVGRATSRSRYSVCTKSLLTICPGTHQHSAAFFNIFFWPPSAGAAFEGSKLARPLLFATRRRRIHWGIGSCDSVNTSPATPFSTSVLSTHELRLIFG
jgi:hypothetical protein